ncbi:MAG: hypothetical protein OEX97_05875 [Acidimicrobiia bacterium]|nr:hypothetical protein [Acidimicrobiia bacterium]
MEHPTDLTPQQLRAEWMRAVSFIVTALGMIVMAFVHFQRNTAWWLVGLAIALAGVVVALVAAFKLDHAQALLRSILRLRFAEAFESLVELNRIPPMTAPHRTPRILAAMFGAVGGAAAILVLARLLTM